LRVAPSALADSTGARPIQVRFAENVVQVDPPGQLLYTPTLVTSAPFDTRHFADADRFEFVDPDDTRLQASLEKLAGNGGPHLRSEALLRLARLHVRRARVADALETYRQLVSDDALTSPVVEVPYALLARVERSRLLSAAKRRGELEVELAELHRGLQSGRWPVRKASFIYYDKLVRDMAGPGTEPASTPVQLAIADAVARLWDNWQGMNRDEDPPPGQWVYHGAGTTLVALVNATPDRLTAVLFTADRMRQLVLDAAASTLHGDGIEVGLLDEQSRPVFGDVTNRGAARAMRTLNVAMLPWQVRVSMRPASDAGGTVRTRYLIVGLSAVMLIVIAACYAMARASIREGQTARVQSEFVSAVSHEFRSPLTTLAQITELLVDRRIKDDGRRQTYYAVMQQETLRLQRLVENLLDFGRMEANRRPYLLEPLDFAELVRAEVREYQAEIGQSGYEIRATAPTDVVPVRGDREALSRAVRNLLENAVKYSPGCRTVWVDTGRDDLRAVLAVRDEGMGIAADEQSRIFEKFVRGEAARQACIRGTGIGLAMVREVVRAHAGEIELVSATGAGSTFTIRLPLMPSGAAGSAA
jgi:signal transduction histidine kinase